MPIFELDKNSLTPIPRTSFSETGIREKEDLQRLLSNQIQIISDDLMVLAEEYGDWEESHRRIDLLALDRNADLVVIELKRTHDGSHMELQALRYAAMVSTMTFDQAVAAHSKFLQDRGISDDPKDSILGFLEWEEPDEERFNSNVRIILVSADFSKEITTAVMWLNERSLDITCVRLSPYKSDDKILLDIQQVIPLPEATDFQISIREKEQRRRSSRWAQKDLPTIKKEFEKRCSPEVFKLAYELYDWLEERVDEIFPTVNAFAPCLSDKSRNRFLFKVMYTGQIEIWFQYLSNKPPFSSIELREDLRTRLNAISGIEIGEDRLGGKPVFPIEALLADNNFNQFKSVVEWMLQKIKDEA